MMIQTRTRRSGTRRRWSGSTALSALAFATLVGGPAGAGSSHEIRRGETLSGIARLHGTTADHLARLNGIVDPARVLAGARLRLPDTPDAPAEVGRHVVKLGESLSQIARRYGVSTKALARANTIERADLIPAGLSLTIPTGRSVPAVPVAPLVSESAQDRPAPTRPAPASQDPIVGPDGRRVVPMQAPADEVLQDSARPTVPDNATVLTTSLPVVIDGRRYAAIPTQTTVQSLVAISPGALADAIGDLLSPEAAAGLRGLGEGLVPIEALAATGVTAVLDTGTLSIAVTLPASARNAQSVSLLADDPFEGAERIYPGRFAAGVTGALVVTDDFDDDQDPVGELAFSGFANFGGLKGINLDYGGSYRFAGDENDFQRDAIVLFKDDPDRALRYSAGDLVPFLPRLAGFAGIAGVSIERNYEELQPTRNVRPTGRRSFFLERRSTVEVYSNGALINRFTAEPGPIDLGDIPLADLSNNVSIVVEDSLGRRELDSFALSNDLTLLASGLSEFSLSAGVLRDDFSEGFNYTSDPVITGFYTRGINDNLTVSGNGALADGLYNAGGSVAWSLAGGVALAETAVSQSDGVGSGFAASFNYRGGPFLGEDRNDTLTLTADYTSEDFASLGDRASLVDSEWFVGADYRFDVGPVTSLSFGGTVQTNYRDDDAGYTAFVGLTQRVGRVVLSMVARAARLPDGRENNGAFISLSLPFGSRQTATASYDSATDTARAEILRSRGIEVPSFDYRLGAVRREDETELNGSVGYTASRFETGLGVTSRLDLPDGASGGQTVTGRLQSGIGFVDGSFGIGRDPGRGFYLFKAHPSLGDARITIETNAGSTPIAQSGALGPAVAPSGQPYRPEELRANVSGGPVGYNIGSGRYVVTPGARTGVGVTIGSDAFRTVVTALAVDGTRVGLAYGTLTNLDTGETQTFFTNRVGRAVFSNLAAGRYRAALQEPAGSFDFTLSEDTEAYVDIGVRDLELEP